MILTDNTHIEDSTKKKKKNTHIEDIKCIMKSFEQCFANGGYFSIPFFIFE